MHSLEDLHDEVRTRCLADLASLSCDGSVSRERFKRCVSAASNLESAITTLATVAWIPGDMPTLRAALFAINQNIRDLQQEIDECLDVVIERCLPDEIFLVWASMGMGRLLEFQRDCLMEAWQRVAHPPATVN